MDSIEILDEIDSLEEHIERLYVSSSVSYDPEYHMRVVDKYRKLVSKIINSDLSEEGKAFMTEIIAELFNEHKDNPWTLEGSDSTNI